MLKLAPPSGLNMVVERQMDCNISMGKSNRFITHVFRQAFLFEAEGAIIIVLNCCMPFKMPACTGRRRPDKLE